MEHLYIVDISIPYSYRIKVNKDTFKFQAGTSEASDLSIPQIDFQSLKKAVLTNLFLDFHAKRVSMLKRVP